MLAIRLQRVGRKGYPVYRVAVQEAQRHPSSGRVVAYVGSYNPHNKDVKFNAEKVAFYLKNGAQPTPRVVKLLKEAKIKLPAWVSKPDKKSASIKNPSKLRKNQPDEPAPAEKETEVPAPAENESAKKEEADAAAPAEKEEKASEADTDQVAEPKKEEKSEEAKA